MFIKHFISSQEVFALFLSHSILLMSANLHRFRASVSAICLQVCMKMSKSLFLRLIENAIFFWHSWSPISHFSARINFQIRNLSERLWPLVLIQTCGTHNFQQHYPRIRFIWLTKADKVLCIALPLIRQLSEDDDDRPWSLGTVLCPQGVFQSLQNMPQ